MIVITIYLFCYFLSNKGEIRNYKQGNYNELSHPLEIFNWTSTYDINIDTYADTYANVINENARKFIPIRNNNFNPHGPPSQEDKQELLKNGW